MKAYALADIFKFVVGVEEEGNVFYKTVAASMTVKRLKDLFTSLAAQEVKHAKIFLKLYKAHAGKNTDFSASEELSELLDTLTRGLLFPDLSEVRDTLAGKSRDAAVAVIRIAMEVELNTILLYRTIRELLAESQTKAVLDAVIQEEEKHLVRLKRVRLDIDPLYAGLRYGKFF